MTSNPKCILLFSGKRKSGKDFITDIINERLGKDQSVIIRLSAPIKLHWSKKHELKYDELLCASEYKEKHRADMIEWSEQMRAQDIGYFIKPAIEMTNAHEKPIWIVSDMRRRSDLEWFHQNYPSLIKTVRIECAKEVRRQRGWIFTEGIDDAESECDLDQFSSWDWRIENNSEISAVESILSEILAYVTSTLQETPNPSK